MTQRSQAGQVTIFVLGMSLLVFAIAGLAVDGTRAWLYRRTLQNAADASALAGAGELSRDTYYRSGGDVDVDVAAARRVAMQWISESGLDVRPASAVDSSGISVVLRGRSRTLFLGIIGIDELAVAAEARAEPRRGPP
ncbi:MAG: pilus assembly protein TadG-related protein [Actinomycetota bacterium]